MQKFLIDEVNNEIKIDETKIKAVTAYTIEAVGPFKKKITLTFIGDVKIIPPNRDENGNVILPIPMERRGKNVTDDYLRTSDNTWILLGSKIR